MCLYPQGHDGVVTLCRYPFVFDAQAKTTLLQTDAVIQMQVIYRMILPSSAAVSPSVDLVSFCVEELNLVQSRNLGPYQLLYRTCENIKIFSSSIAPSLH